MREPADLLILDEPTNDLDIPTLEVLEDSLAEFDGGLVLVTHDRFMLERVSTVILALDGEGGTATFADYAQWELAQSAAGPAPPRRATERASQGERPERAFQGERARPKRLGYREQREWDGMERAILDAERAVAACQRGVEDPAIASDSTALQQRYAALEVAQAEVSRLYARWAELEAKGATPGGATGRGACASDGGRGATGRGSGSDTVPPRTRRGRPRATQQAGARS